MEIRPGETRVAATPETVKKLIGQGHTVVIQKGAGITASQPDSAYEAVGASIGSAADAFGAEIILKVRAPEAAELKHIQSGSVLVGMLDPFDNDNIAAMAAQGVTAFSLEAAPRTTRAQSMDVLSSQANIAGYKAVMIGANEYQRFMPMLMTAAGTVKAARVLILGAGVAGLQAIATAKRLGAVIEASDVRPAAKEQIESLGAKFVDVPYETDEERERIREARREERRLKKDLKKQRDISAKNKINSLERRNEELAKRLAAVENTAASYQFAQIDKAVEDESTRVEYAKMKMLQAAQAGDVSAQMEFLEQLTDAKQRLNQVQHYKKQQLEQAKSPKQNVPNQLTEDVQRNATKWLKKHSWYDPQARDTDSRIAKVIDQELAADGWDPSDSDYWEELDNRLQSRLPHRYTSKGGAQKRGGPTASSRVSNTTSAKPNTITLSRERVQAIKDAGSWDDVEKRNKMIRAYASYDRENKG